jgi:hypothetical protein
MHTRGITHAVRRGGCLYLTPGRHAPHPCDRYTGPYRAAAFRPNPCLAGGLRSAAGPAARRPPGTARRRGG